MTAKIPVITIDQGIPVPEELLHYPFDQLEVGESFVIPLSKRSSVQARATKVKQKTGKEFSIRKQNSKTARVWRTK